MLELQAVLHRPALAELLGMTPRALQFFLYRLQPKHRYRTFTIAKRAGGVRTIRAPIVPLKRAQERAAELLGAYYEPRACVFSYVKDRSIQMNAAGHVGKRWVLRVDLQDFFPSINFGRVRGMLLAPPFSLPPDVATTLAQICCHENQLPQGSPASPVISNLICRGLDNALAKLARAHRCTYTRYCDDLVFSTNRRVFPAVLAELDPEKPSTVMVGPALLQEIQKAGFVVNPAKVRLAPNSQRQMVTGIVTNARLNVPRKFLRDVRMVLFVWKQHGRDAAATWYFDKHDKRNRAPGKATPLFEQVIGGRVQYLGSVRGWNDPTYLRMASKLAALDPKFRPTQRKVVKHLQDIVLHLYVEGRTDKRHIEMALASLQSQGRFKDLRLQIDEKDRGSQDLLKLCRSLSERPQTAPCVFVFDSDERQIITQVTLNSNETKNWGNSVYSLVIAPPAHRAADDRICIELLYADGDLCRTDEAGRRLFLGAEFRQPSGRHVSLEAYTTTPNKSSLVIEENVFDFAETKLCLSKSGFVKVIQRDAAKVDFQGFAPLFEQLVTLRDELGAGA